MNLKLILLSICFILLTSCSRNTSNKIMYSNLQGDSSQKEVRELLAQKDVHSTHIKTYFNYVNDINQRAISPLVNQFVPMTKDSLTYSDFVYQTSDTLEINAKIAAFILLMDAIDVDTICNLEDTYLSDDISFLNNTLLLENEDINSYACLYSSVSVSEGDLKEHITSIDTYFKTIDLEISDDFNISLIRLYVHNPNKNVRYVQHAGVLIEKYRDLLFIEKYGLNCPFQATKFDNRTQLIHYLLDRPNIQTTSSLIPLIYENNKLLSPTS